ncbi:MAG TPA: hypothetical protein VFM99_06125 [Chitinophagales bacterium]|nr:hypothetical protein [Chitinophagales bacterium]
MKKSIILVAVIAAFSFASCKKDYTCVCKSAGIEVARTTIKDTKKKAKDACTGLSDNYKSLGADISCDVE